MVQVCSWPSLSQVTPAAFCSPNLASYAHCTSPEGILANFCSCAHTHTHTHLHTETRAHTHRDTCSYTHMHPRFIGKAIPAHTDLWHTHGHWGHPKSTALVLLATLFLRQARMPWMSRAFLASWAHCQLMISYCQLAFPNLPLAFPSPFQPDTFPAPLPWPCSSARDFCDASESPSTWPFWTPYNWPWLFNPACSDSAADSSYFPADEHSHPAWCHLWTYWKCTQSPHSDHW